MESFQTILAQLYRVHLSQSMHIPLERFIVNIMDEIPLPDKGSILIQHEIGTQIIPFYRPVDQYPPYSTKQSIENLFKCLSVEYVLEIFF